MLIELLLKQLLNSMCIMDAIIITTIYDVRQALLHVQVFISHRTFDFSLLLIYNTSFYN